MKRIEFKVNEDNKRWEDIEVTQTELMLDEDPTRDREHIFNQARRLAEKTGREVRWNQEGSYQGYYVSTKLEHSNSTARMQEDLAGLKEMVERINKMSLVNHNAQCTAIAALIAKQHEIKDILNKRAAYETARQTNR